MPESTKQPNGSRTAPAGGRNGRRRLRLLALTLVLALLLLRGSRLKADENDVGYRKSYYLEDDNRIHVSTDIWQFDVGLSDTVRATGDVVVDAISGATPLGAPPQKQWPFPKFDFYFQPVYQSIYASEFNQFVQNNLNYVNAGLETYQQLTNQAAAFAQGIAGSLATNSALASLNNLSTNRNYRKNTVPLTQMHDHRNAFTFSLPLTLHEQQVTPTFSYSAESDYISFGGALNYSLNLNQKNTTLNFGWAHDSDSVRDDRFKWRSKMTDDIFVGVVQLFGPKAYLTFNTSIGFEHGYLADPYRGVMAATNFVQLNPADPALSPERRPRHRNTEVAYIAWTQFITPLNGSYEASYRFFHDSYGVSSSTVELDWHQKIFKNVVVSPTFRYAYQNAADFYYLLVPDFKHLPAYYSSDYRLSEMETFALGIDITWRVTKHLSLDAGYMRYIMKGLDGVTSPSAYPQANVFSVGARVWF
jgi:hypothetical protein